MEYKNCCYWAIQCQNGSLLTSSGVPLLWNDPSEARNYKYWCETDKVVRVVVQIEYIAKVGG